MTGIEMMNKALSLLGYPNADRFTSRAITVMNAVYSDLFYIHGNSGFVPLNRLSDEIELPERALNDIMPYGVAKLFAESENDGDNQQLYATIFNQKRNALSHNDSVKDVIPFPL